MTQSAFLHATTTDLQKPRAGIELFDDEHPGYTTLYIRYTDGTRSGARDVFMGDPVHAADVLSAWCSGQFVIDHRSQPVMTRDELNTAAADMIARMKSAGIDSDAIDRVHLAIQFAINPEFRKTVCDMVAAVNGV